MRANSSHRQCNGGWDGSSEPELLVASAQLDSMPSVSPDSRWLAHVGNESGVFEVYVRPFPDASSGRWQISTNGGDEPVWSPDGQELYYRNANRLMSVSVSEGTPATWSAPSMLFDRVYFSRLGFRTYDVAPDGRFLMVSVGLGAARSSGVNVIENWTTELAELVTPFE